jgi:hypothetical protein
MSNHESDILVSFTRIGPSVFINFSIAMDDAKISAGVTLKFLGKPAYPEKCPVRLAFALSIFGDGTLPEFLVCCDGQLQTALLVSANPEYASATV